MAAKQHFNTDGEIIENKVGDLLKLPGFSYHCLQELVHLEERKLAKLIKHG